MFRTEIVSRMNDVPVENYEKAFGKERKVTLCGLCNGEIVQIGKRYTHVNGSPGHQALPKVEDGH